MENLTQPLSPAAQAIWEAFNKAEAGDKLAAALRALAKQREPLLYVVYEDDILAIASELEGGRQ
jgi:hypothetical protein